MLRYPERVGRPFLWAHRGASASRPDNTLASFLLAERQGADGVELDVHLTRDGVVAVVHDAWVSPVTWRFGHDGSPSAEVRAPAADVASGAVRVDLEAGEAGLRALVHEAVASRRLVGGMNWPELRGVVRGYDEEGRPLYAPRLEELFEALAPHTALDIEVKSAPAPYPDLAYPGLLEAVIAIVRRYRAEERAIISSFDHRLLRRAAAAAPDIATLAIYHARLVDVPAMAATIPTRHVNMEVDLASEEDVRACHEAGLCVSVGGLTSAEDLARAARWGADAVTLDDPRWAAEAGLPEAAGAGIESGR